MAINPAESAAAAYLLGLPKEERTAAAARVNQLVKAQAPPSDSEPVIPVRTLGEYLDDKIEVPPFLVSGGQLITGEISVLIARAGKGKTTFGMNRLIRWSAGAPLFDDLTDYQVPERPLKMMMVENEGAAYFMQEKLGILMDHGAELDAEQQAQARENALIWGDGGYSGLKIDKEKDLELLERGIEKHRPDVLYMEPLRGIWTGEENSSTELEAVLDALNALAAQYGFAVMLSHHERKGGAGEDGEEMNRARGSAVLEAKCAVMENWREVKSGEYRELSWSKSRYAPKPPPIRMEFNHHEWRYSMVPEDEVASAILKMMGDDPDGWFWVRELAEEIDESETKIGNALKDLTKDERVLRRRQTSGERQGYRYRLKYDEDSNDGLAI